MADQVFMVMVRHDEFRRVGELVRLDDEAQSDWIYSIEKEYLVQVDDPETDPAPAPLDPLGAQLGEAIDAPEADAALADVAPGPVGTLRHLGRPGA